MKDIYTLDVDFPVFERIMQGKCNSIAFVNDKARKTYKQGNLLTIATEIYNEDGEEKKENVKAEIIDLLYFDTIKDLVAMVGKENIGYTKSMTIDKIEDAILQDFKNEEVEKHGLVAVFFELR